MAYAEKTTIPVSRTKADIEDLVQRYGADQFISGYRNDLAFTGKKIEKENYLSLSKRKNEIKFENQSDTEISTILLSVMQMWKQHIMFLNLEENRYLAELRDTLLPDLMSGKISLEGGNNRNA